MKSIGKENLLPKREDTIAAVSTPAGEGGIGIVRLSGKKALSIADKIFVSKDKAKPSAFKTYTTHYGHIIRHPLPVTRHPSTQLQSRKLRPGHGSQLTGHEIKNLTAVKSTSHKLRVTDDDVIDEVILTVMRAPKSYTKEDVVEINCHGGIVSLRKALDLALSLGARLAEPGEFTKRAFINGRIDLTQAEAVLDIIKSKTESSMKVALGQLEGGLSRKIKSLKRALLDMLGEIEAEIDFSDEDIELAPKQKIAQKLTKISSEIKRLIDDAWKGMIFKEGVMCVICGKPNVGKSSLMNVLLRRNRVIVTPIPGTTRDAIEEEISLNGIPVRIVDTAGISVAKNIVEKHGIRKSKSYIKTADLILFMLDLSQQWSRIDGEIFNNIKSRNFITIANKIDLAGKLDIDRVKKIIAGNEIIEVSLRQRKNLNKLEKAISQKIWHGQVPHPEGSFVTNLRHRKNLESAEKCIKKVIKALGKLPQPPPEIVASDLKEALSFLGSILGDTIEPDILNRIFSKFCIGK